MKTIVQMRCGCGDFLPALGYGPWNLNWIPDFWYRDSYATDGIPHCMVGMDKAEPNMIEVWQVKSKTYLLQKFDKKIRLDIREQC
jgi:hypothetical protein